MSESRIYMDYNASTPVTPAAVEAMLPYLKEESAFGNPSRPHWAGLEARVGLTEAKPHVARLFNCTPDEVIFTSGGTESNNHAIKGVYYALKAQGEPCHIITTAVEHPATLKVLEFLEKVHGARVSIIPTDAEGAVNVELLAAAISEDTRLISVMHANNEYGTIQPIEQIADLIEQHQSPQKPIYLHVDCVCSAGKIPIDVRAMKADLASISGHKLYAPKGIGALYVRSGLNPGNQSPESSHLASLVHGAGQQAGFRSGTDSVPLAAALGAACKEALEHLPEMSDVESLSELLREQLTNNFGEKLVIFGSHSSSQRLPNTVCFSFPGTKGEELLAKLPEFAATAGPGCSDVVKAMGVAEPVALGAIRCSLGKFSTRSHIEHLIAELKKLL